MKKIISRIIFLSTCLLLSSNVFAQQIQQINVTGNITFTVNEILQKVSSRIGEEFNEKSASEDAKKIATMPGIEYAYYNISKSKDGVILNFVVVEKNLVRSIDFVGNEKLSYKKLVKVTDLKVGNYLDIIAAQAAVEKIREYYLKKGFPFAVVSLQKEKISVGKVVYNITEGPKVKVAKVGFSGNKNIKASLLEKVVKTKTRKFFVLQAYYNPKKLEDDVENLKEVYYRNGFLDVKIDPAVEFNQNRTIAKVLFNINEGPAYTINKIEIAGNSYFDNKTLWDYIKSKAQKTYNQSTVRDDVEALLKSYRQIGFIDAKVESKLSFISKKAVNITYNITEGQRFRIGLVEISGNQQTQDKVVRHILDEFDFVPGNWYNADLARGDGSGYLEKYIRKTAITDSATITPSGKEKDKRDAQVSIIERQTGMIMLGAGVSTDNGAMGQLVFEQKNFDIKNKPKSLLEFLTGKAYKGAGQSLRVALEPGTEFSRYSISFTEPYLRNKPISMNVTGESYQRQWESYDEDRIKGYLGFEKRYKNNWTRSLGFRVSSVDVKSIDNDAPQEIKDVKGKNSLVGVAFGVSRDLTDDKFDPSVGKRYNLNLEVAGGDDSFSVLTGTYKKYRTLRKDLLDRKTILTTKIHAGTIFGTAPPFEKFYAGGSNSIRGFDYRGVSTRGMQTNVSSPKKKDPIGSDWIFLANAEVAVPLVKKSLDALFFVDSGAIDSGGYRASIGIGVQIKIPQWFGPVPMRAAIAVPFMKNSEDDTQVFSFSVGRFF